jgi:hypothetical protein
MATQGRPTSIEVTVPYDERWHDSPPAGPHRLWVWPTVGDDRPRVHSTPAPATAWDWANPPAPMLFTCPIFRVRAMSWAEVRRARRAHRRVLLRRARQTGPRGQDRRVES